VRGPNLSISADPVRGPGERSSQAATPTVAPDPEETEMFTIEEESGTYTGSRRRHNGYYAGDFSQTPMLTPSELSALAKLPTPTFPSTYGNAG
jgi:hypothetical protein